MTLAKIFDINLIGSKLFTSFRSVFSDNSLIFLVLIFSAIYLPHAFILVEDIGLIVAHEVDPGSHIIAIEKILETYNMNAGYHSKYYGWTYYVINFIALSPVKLFCSAFGIKSKFYLYFGIKFILFSIGLASFVAFYKIMKRLFSEKYIAIIASLFYIISNVGYTYFYFIHPETTGIMFIFFAILCLLRFIDEPSRYKFYFYGLSCLVLASLSKQLFFFISLPILGLFYQIYCTHNGLQYWKFIFSKYFGKILVITSLISVAILFIIHPFAILDFSNSLKYQQDLSAFTTGKYSLSLESAFVSWYASLSSSPIIALSLLLSPLSLIVGTFYYLKQRQNYHYLLYIYNLIGIIVITLLILFVNRLFISLSYFQPLYPFIIINIAAIYVFIKNINSSRLKIVQFATIIFLTYYIFFSFCRSVYVNIPHIFNRLEYKNSVSYITYNYIKNHITSNDKLVYDHFVALPSAMKNGCHYWHGCGTDYIDTFKPNYIMFNAQYSANGGPYLETERLKKYIAKNNMYLIETLHSLDADNIAISVYKK